MRIVVTQEDIDKGFIRDAERCVIAQSFLRRNTNSYPVIGLETLSYNDKKGFYCNKRMTQPMKDFIDDFDNGKPVKPTTFYLK